MLFYEAVISDILKIFVLSISNYEKTLVFKQNITEQALLNAPLLNLLTSITFLSICFLFLICFDICLSIFYFNMFSCKIIIDAKSPDAKAEP